MYLKKTVKALKEGEIVLVPTETVFGVAVILNNEDAFNKLMELKHRPKEKHFPICVGSIKQISIVAEPNIYCDKLLPNPITLILKSHNLPSYLEEDTVAIRFPKNKFINKVCNKLGSPILLTSANISGQEPIKNIKEAKKIFGNKIKVYVKGKVKIGKPSTIVSIKDNNINVLREGPISKEAISKMIGE